MFETIFILQLVFHILLFFCCPECSDLAKGDTFQRTPNYRAEKIDETGNQVGWILYQQILTNFTINILLLEDKIINDVLFYCMKQPIMVTYVL